MLGRELSGIVVHEVVERHEIAMVVDLIPSIYHVVGHRVPFDLELSVVVDADYLSPVNVVEVL